MYLFIKVLSKKAESIVIIPKNEEKFVTAIATFKGLKLKARFMDSFRFMSASLDSLAKNLNIGELVNTRKQINLKRANGTRIAIWMNFLQSQP